MKVLVCGSRTWTDGDAIYDRLRRLGRGTIVIQGGARGADRYAELAAFRLGYPTSTFYPDYLRYGRHRAPLERNLVMLDQGPELVIAFQRNGSRGTQHTINEARRRGIPVEVHAA